MLHFSSYLPEERKSLHHFHMFVFLGGSLHCFWCTWTCYECSKCMYRRDTECELCFIYFLYNERKFSLVKKVVWVVHQLQCILYASLTFQTLPNQSQFMLSLPLYLQSIHDKEFERNLLQLHTVSMFTRHTLDVQPSVLNCECSS